MKRIKDGFLEILEKVVPLAGTVVAEFGCGNGRYSEQLAARCRVLTGIDPDKDAINVAQERQIPNAKFLYCPSPLNSGLAAAHFDVTAFTLALHHVFPPAMRGTISEAVRVTKPGGHLVFLEPGTKGSFFDAEIRFNAFDGDERGVKARAQRELREHPQLELVADCVDETAFMFDSVQDFMATMKPSDNEWRFKNLHELEPFLVNHQYSLVAERYIKIYKPRL